MQPSTQQTIIFMQQQMNNGHIDAVERTKIQSHSQQQNHQTALASYHSNGQAPSSNGIHQSANGGLMPGGFYNSQQVMTNQMI